MVLEHSEPLRGPSAQYEKEFEALNDCWLHQRLPRLTALSTRGNFVLAESVAAPQTVIEAVRDVVTEVRAKGRKWADD